MVQRTAAWVLVSLWLAIGGLPVADAQVVPDPEIELRAEVMPAGDLLREGNRTIGDRTLATEQALLQVHVTCRSTLPVAVQEADGHLFVELGSGEFWVTPYAEVDGVPVERDASVPLSFDRTECVAGATKTVRVPVLFAPHFFFLDVGAPVPMSATVAYYGAQETLQWDERVGAVLGPADLAFRSPWVERFDDDEWLLDEARLSTSANGPFTFRGVVLTPPKEGAIRFAPETAHSDGRIFSDPMQVIWNGTDPQTGLAGLAFGYEVTFPADPGVTFFVPHPGTFTLSPFERADTIQFDEAPAPPLLVLPLALLAVARLLRTPRT